MNKEQKQTQETGPAKATVISLGLDVHKEQITWVEQRDGGRPGAARRGSQGEVLSMVGRWVEEGAKVYTCYEAGCFGYGLHRSLCAMGAINLVIAPQDWDERKQRVKNDQRDACELSRRLVRYLGGDERAFCVVRVPTPEQEMRRARVRQRNTMMRERVQMVVRGRGLLLAQGVHTARDWWRPAHWRSLAASLSPGLRGLVEPWREFILQLRKQQMNLEKEIIAAVDLSAVPVGVGAWSWEAIGAELCDWTRFKNRRQVAGYTGLTPSEHSSGGSRRQGSIAKTGNSHVRHSLIEMLWRMVRFQKQWRGIKKLPVLLDAKAPSRRRRKAAVAGARLLAIDLWRLATGQTTASNLGMRLPTPALSAAAMK